MILRRYSIAVLVSSLGVLITVAWINRETPFRAEHWALLYAHLNSADWLSDWRAISGFVCFGDRRFQPLTFFPSVIPYLFFGNHFFWHYLVSVALHVFYVATILLLVDSVASEPKRRGFLFMRYPLEAAFLLVSFIAADVITWSMYSYLQLASCLIYFSIYLFWTQRQLAAYALILFATCFYEAAWGMGLLFLAVSIPQREKSWRNWFIGLAGLSAMGGILYLRYLDHLGAVALYSGKNLPLVLSFSSLQKAAMVFIKWLFTMGVLGTHLLWPSGSQKGTLFELSIPVFFQQSYAVGFMLVLLVSLLLFIRSHRLLFLLLGSLVLFAMIAWPRTDATSYVIHQFRYAYLLSGFTFVFCYAFFQKSVLRWPKLYAALLFLGIGLHAAATLRHAREVQLAMLPLARAVQAQKGVSSAQVINEVTRALAYGRIEASVGDQAFIYNANSCMQQWINWSAKP